MTDQQIVEQLDTVIASGAPLGQIVNVLRQYREAGVAREEAMGALETLRSQAHDENREDRILEVMDIVSGFCSQENTVWAD